MFDQFTLLLVLSISVIFLILSLILLILLVKSMRDQAKLPLKLLSQQLAENQKLRNQLVSPDVPTLMGMNQATGVSVPESLSTDSVNVDLPEAIMQEDILAQAGYELGDLGHDLESAGWTSPIIKRTGDEPIAYEA